MTATKRRVEAADSHTLKEGTAKLSKVRAAAVAYWPFILQLLVGLLQNSTPVTVCLTR